MARLQDIYSADNKLLIASHDLYSHDVNKMFDSVPKLQACSRGIRITYQPELGAKPAKFKIRTADRQLLVQVGFTYRGATDIITTKSGGVTVYGLPQK